MWVGVGRWMVGGGNCCWRGRGLKRNRQKKKTTLHKDLNDGWGLLVKVYHEMFDLDVKMVGVMNLYKHCLVTLLFFFSFLVFFFLFLSPSLFLLIDFFFF